MLPSYLTSGQLWGMILPIPAFAALFAACIAFISWRRNGDWATIFAITLAISMLGIVTGVITGSSRESAVGAVLPVVLTVIGGFAAYIFTTREASVHVMASLVILSLSTNLLVGTFWGAKLHQDHDDYYASATWRWQQELGEAGLRILRKKYDMPEPVAASAKGEALCTDVVRWCPDPNTSQAIK